jgi:hypothetical protein
MVQNLVEVIRWDIFETGPQVFVGDVARGPDLGHDKIASHPFDGGAAFGRT